MQSFLNKFKHSSSSSNSHNSLAAAAEDKKNQLKTNNDNNNKSDAKSSSPTNVNTKKSSINSNSSLSKIITTASNVPSKQHTSVFSIAIQKDKLNSKKSSSPKQTKNNSLKKNELNVFSLIIDSAPLATDSTQTSDENNNIQIFDPELAPEETYTCNQSTFIDDRSFIYDDEDLLDRRLSGLAKENNCFTINEVPEGRLSKMSSKSSRASSRSSVCSNSTHDSSNIFADQSDHLSSGLADMTRQKTKIFDSSNNSEESGSENKLEKGSKNALLDALIKKFNVATEFDNAMDSNSDNTSGARTGSLVKKQLPIRYHGEDHKRKQSELQRKINRNNHEKSKVNNAAIADSNEDKIEATSSFDDEPKQIKVVKSTSTQISRTLHKRNNYYKTLSVTRLPQSFECKYMGKTRCSGLWGLKHIREPVDHLVSESRKLRSLDELPDVEALISEKGIYIVQKSKTIVQNQIEINSMINTNTVKSNQTTMTSLTSNLNIENPVKEPLKKTEKYYQSGLLPISNISYAVQDNYFGKVFSCIVVRERETKTVSECYSFLCKQNEMSRRMALSITLAFKEYGKLLQLKETQINRTIQIHGAVTEKNADSFA